MLAHAYCGYYSNRRHVKRVQPMWQASRELYKPCNLIFTTMRHVSDSTCCVNTVTCKVRDFVMASRVQNVSFTCICFSKEARVQGGVHARNEPSSTFWYVSTKLKLWISISGMGNYLTGRPHHRVYATFTGHRFYWCNTVNVWFMFAMEALTKFKYKPT